MPASRSVNSRRGLQRLRLFAVGAVLAAVVGDRTVLHADAPEATLVVPRLDAPALLAPGDVASGLRKRLAAMADGEAERQLERSVGDPRDYQPPADVENGPPPPDAPGGEADLEGAGGDQ